MKQHYPSGAENCWQVSGGVEKVTQTRPPHQTSFLEGERKQRNQIQQPGEFSKKGPVAARALPESPRNLWLLGFIDPEIGGTSKVRCSS